MVWSQILFSENVIVTRIRTFKLAVSNFHTIVKVWGVYNLIKDSKMCLCVFCAESKKTCNIQNYLNQVLVFIQNNQSQCVSKIICGCETCGAFVSEKRYTRIFKHYESHSITFVIWIRICEARQSNQVYVCVKFNSNSNFQTVIK